MHVCMYVCMYIYIYKPDSKKVGTLYKLWIKTECNDVEVSNFNILFRIQHMTYQMFKLRKCIILREKFGFKFHGINTSQKSWDKAMFTTVWHPLFFL